ncbi:MAG: diguanylate cyclase [Deltaproteobacteria bacterium]|nr:diguanylate cyclase [Deltaproteobacteria bacterium]
MFSVFWVGGTPSVFDPSLTLQETGGIEEILNGQKKIQPVDTVVLQLEELSEKALLSIRGLRDVVPRRIPLIVVAETSDVSLVARLMQMGVNDILSRHEIGKLGETVKRAVERSRIERDWSSVIAEAFDQASHDPLTHLPNRYLLQDRLGQALKEANRHDEIIALLFLDLDDFKAINDQWGHAVGDQCLIEFSRRLRLGIREGDTVARYGGDEFVILLRYLGDPGEVNLVVERLQKILRQPIEIEDQIFHCSASIGISLCPGHAREGTELMKKADEALLLAKRAGTSQIRYARAVKELKQEVFMKRKNIMIVDDEEDVQTLLRKRLQREGFSCFSCASVEEALSQLKTVHPELIILDLGFKSASGIAFLQNMDRYLPAGEKPQVVILSAYGDPDIVKYAKSLGVKSFLTKPFDSVHLLETVNRFFH